MALTLTTDPIISLVDARALLALNSEQTAIMLINSVSAKFLQYTHRIRINHSGSGEPVTDQTRGRDSYVLWVHAAPVDIEEDVTVVLTSGGNAGATFDLDDGTLAVSGDGTRITLYNAGAPYSVGEENVTMTYVGGWKQVPGDVIAGAIEQMRIDKMRMEGLTGVASVSRSGESVQYDQGAIIKSVAQAWAPYRVLV